MSDNKYELKSNDLQELMRKVPHVFIVWGNIFVFFFLVSGMLILNEFDVYDKKNITFKILNVKGVRTDSLIIAMSTHNVDQISANQAINIEIENKGLQYSHVGRVITLKQNYKYESQLYVIVNKTTHILNPGMIGQAEIVLNKSSFLINLAKGATSK